MFVIYTADTIVSFSAPYVISLHTQSAALMGIIIGSSSLIGLLVDLIVSETHRNKGFAFFLRYVFIFASICSLILLLFPPLPFWFFIAMACWGIYFDMMRFANFKAVYAMSKPDDYAYAWGAIEESRYLSYVLGPLIALELLVLGEKLNFQVVLGLLLISSILIQILTFKSKRYNKEEKLPKLGFRHELVVIKSVLKKIWPVYLFLLSMFILDAAFWTVGILLGIELSETTTLGKFVMLAYSWPGVVVALFAGRLAHYFDKTKAALIAGVAGSLLLFVGLGLFPSEAIFFVVLVSSILFALVWPEIFATIEDFALKYSEYRSEVVGLGDSASNLGYVIGPILAGILSMRVGNIQAMMLISMIPLSVGLAALVLYMRASSKQEEIL